MRYDCSIGKSVLRNASFMVLSLAIAACRSAHPVPAADPGAPSAERFPGANAVLAGFDPLEPEAEWRAGDRLLFALSTASGDRIRTKLVGIELLGPCLLKSTQESSIPVVESIGLSATLGTRHVNWNSPLLRVAVRVYETDGRLVQETEAKVPETVLRTGMHAALVLCSELQARAAGAGGAQHAAVSDEETRLFGETAIMLPTLLGIFQEDSVLKSLLMQVVGTPSLLSLLRGIDVHTSGDLAEASVVTDSHVLPYPTGPIYRLPLDVAVNDDPMLEIELEIAATDPPLRLCGGIIAMKGVAHGDARRSARLELLAARRGPPGQEIRM